MLPRDDADVPYWVEQPCFPVCIGRWIPHAGDLLNVNGQTFHVDRTFRCCAFDRARCHPVYDFSDQIETGG